MLLVPPPLSRENWIAADREADAFRQMFLKYVDDYEAAVLTLGSNEVADIRAWITRDHDRPLSPQSIHSIVTRELQETCWEASSKVAILMLTVAMCQECTSLPPNTLQRLRICRRFVPVVLLMAIEDHFGLLDGSAA